jgi:hypothetical protein
MYFSLLIIVLSTNCSLLMYYLSLSVSTPHSALHSLRCVCLHFALCNALRCLSQSNCSSKRSSAAVCGLPELDLLQSTFCVLSLCRNCLLYCTVLRSIRLLLYIHYVRPLLYYDMLDGVVLCDLNLESPVSCVACRFEVTLPKYAQKLLILLSVCI